MNPWIMGGIFLALVMVGMAKTIKQSNGSDGSVTQGGGLIPLSVLSQAIARAEGYYAAGSKAQRYNNPGNIYTSGGAVYATFPTPEAGFQALEDNIRRYNSGSWISPLVTTWRDLAWMWVNGTAPGAADSRGMGDNPDAWLAIIQADIAGKTGIFIDPMGDFRSDVAF